MEFGFDVISDLNLLANDTFNWEGKATSLYCLIPGNISDDVQIIIKTLRHLAQYYQGIFYIDGGLEHPNLENSQRRLKEINSACKLIRNVVFLHNNVVVVDGVAMVGINGWYGNYAPKKSDDYVYMEVYRNEDLGYLTKTLEKLQLHIDVRKIIVISNSVPCEELFFGEAPALPDELGPNTGLVTDTEAKVVAWVYGSYEKEVDTTLHGINYVNNSCYNRQSYWPKRITVDA